MVRIALVSAVALVLAACNKPEPTPPAPPAVAEQPPAAVKPAPVVPTADGKFDAAIKAEDVAARMQTLSSNQFEGRKPGTIGERVTTAYIKDQFERAGLKPGNNGSWFQTVPIIQTTLLDPTSTVLDVSGGNGNERLAYATDMMVGSLDASTSVDLKDSEIVFVGYGVDAPDWNDYADVDVKGKTVIILVNDPGWGNQDAELFKGKTLTYYGRWTYKYEEAARKGAAAAFVVHETGGAGYGWGVIESGWAGPQQSLPPAEAGGPRLQSAGWLTEAAATRLFASAGTEFAALKKSADLRGFKPIALDAKLSVSYKSKVESSSSENVIGYLPGSERPDETIIYTAHWDHLGRDEKLEGDQIYNGAVDNATGVAGIIEIAEAFARQSPPPKRSIVFNAVTLEESGLIGSAYYAAHPSFPIDKTVANINLDALPVNGPTRNVTVIGLGQSELDGYIEEAATAQGRVIGGDEEPEKGFFFRSDHVSFARVGVPALYASGGLDLVEGGEAVGRASAEDYTTNRYHKPGDNYDANWDLRGLVADLEALYAVGRKLGDETTYPQWKAGADFARPKR
ncbi:MAG: M28 family metallopeptidase [Dokdonella sp.]